MTTCHLTVQPFNGEAYELVFTLADGQRVKMMEQGGPLDAQQTEFDFDPNDVVHLSWARMSDGSYGGEYGVTQEGEVTQECVLTPPYVPASGRQDSLVLRKLPEATTTTDVPTSTTTTTALDQPTTSTTEPPTTVIATPTPMPPATVMEVPPTAPPSLVELPPATFIEVPVERIPQLPVTGPSLADALMTLGLFFIGLGSILYAVHRNFIEKDKD